MFDEYDIPAIEYTDPDESPFWEDAFESIVQSYPKAEQECVRVDIMNGRNLEEYGIKVVILVVLDS